MTSFELTLPVAAHTKQRTRFGRGRAFTPAETRGWEEMLAWRFIEQHGRPRLTCPVRVELFFGGVQSNQDIDNLAKSCLDALNGIAFEDDRQVVELVARKASGRTPQTAITITEVRP
jgi:Holliday junction resolvase RusA-like endonuclease